jgi:hypothetical protein
VKSTAKTAPDIAILRRTYAIRAMSAKKLAQIRISIGVGPSLSGFSGLTRYLIEDEN